MYDGGRRRRACHRAFCSRALPWRAGPSILFSTVRHPPTPSMLTCLRWNDGGMASGRRAHARRVVGSVRAGARQRGHFRLWCRGGRTHAHRQPERRDVRRACVQGPLAARRAQYLVLPGFFPPRGACSSTSSLQRQVRLTLSREAPCCTTKFWRKGSKRALTLLPCTFLDNSGFH